MLFWSSGGRGMGASRKARRIGEDEAMLRAVVVALEALTD
jgi:hypothetical protein